MARPSSSFRNEGDNGSPITGYTVTASPGGEQASGPASPITVSGLTNGTTYTFTATATNALGTSPPSEPSGSAEPMAAPAMTSAPTTHGAAEVGDTLTGSAGGWTGYQDTYRYQWLDCDGDSSNCDAISGATSTDYVVPPEDGGLSARWR